MMLRYFLGVLAILIPLTHGQMKVTYDNSAPSPNYVDKEAKGYRYCPTWKLADGTPLYSSCDPYSFNRCGKELEKSYECCPGFTKTDPSVFPPNSKGNPVCGTPIPPWKSCPKVMEMTGKSPGIASAIKNNDIFSENSNDAYTIFSPLAGLRLQGTSPSADNALLYHVVKGRYNAEDLVNNQELTSVYRNQKLLVTKYSNGIVCIDCVELSQADLECKNGVIHFIRKQLIPAKSENYVKKNLYDTMMANSDISSFANSIPSDLKSQLQNVNARSRFTVFPIKNSAWNKVKSKYSGKQLEEIVRNHVMTKMQCSAALHKHSQDLETSNKQPVTSSCKTKGPKEERHCTDDCGNERKYVSTDHMASNGVYHILEDALIPSSALSLQDIIKNPKCKSSFFLQSQTFFNSLKDCDLRMKPDKKYTVLVPMDVSYEWWKKYPQFKFEYDTYQKDKEYRCRVARYHIVEQNPELSDLKKLPHQLKGYKSNEAKDLFQTNYFLKDKDHSDLYFHYSPVAGFKSTKLKDVTMFRIAKINVIPEKKIMQVLKETPDLKRSHELAKKANMEKDVFTPNQPLNLYLATQSKGLDQKDVKKTIDAFTPEGLKNFNLLHTVPNYLWGGDIGYFKKNSVHKFPSRAGKELIFWTNDKKETRIGYKDLPKDQWPKVIKFNLHAKDGNVWILDKPLPCPKKLCPQKKKRKIVIDYDYLDLYATACQYKEINKIDLKNPDKDFNMNPIKISDANPEYCAKYKQATFKMKKQFKPKG